jgi:hypothetical protein
LVVGLLAAGFLPTLLTGQLLVDMTAHTLAGERLKTTGQIYSSYPGDLVPYKYAPWFAALWIPLTFIPTAVVGALWLTTLVGSAAWLLWRAPWWLAVFAGPFVAWGAAIGNAGPLLYAVLAAAASTRAAGYAIGAVASLKAFPILLVLTLLRTHRWRDAVIACVTAVALAAPMLWFDLSGYQVSAEGPRSIFNVLGAWAWGMGAVAGCAIALWRPRWGTGGLAVVLANPRFQWYDLGYLLIEPRPVRTPRSVGRYEQDGTDT